MSSLNQRRERGEEEKGHHHRDSLDHNGWRLPSPNWSGDIPPNPNLSSNSDGLPTPTSSGTVPATTASTKAGSYTTAMIFTTEDIDSMTPTAVGEPSGVQATVEASGSTGHRPEFMEAPQKGLGNKALGAVAGTIAMMALLVIGLVAFLFLRRRRRQRQRQASSSQMQQIKTGTQPYTPPRTRTSHIYPQYAAPPNHAPPPALAPPPPVILGPIVPGSNGAYYTGIDTSDVVSVHDRSGLGNPFADGDSLNDEPPPPYRPRSFGLMSRNSSLRAPPAATTSQTHLIGENRQPNRSPFEDPLDDDAVSDISSPTLRGTNDRMSVVSDLSYQEDPVVTRPAV